MGKHAVPISEPHGARYQAAGRPVTCPQCDGEIFREVEAYLLDGDRLPAGVSVHTLVCDTCSRLEMFLESPMRRS